METSWNILSNSLWKIVFAQSINIMTIKSSWNFNAKEWTFYLLSLNFKLRCSSFAMHISLSSQVHVHSLNLYDSNKNAINVAQKVFAISRYMIFRPSPHWQRAPQVKWIHMTWCLMPCSCQRDIYFIECVWPLMTNVCGAFYLLKSNGICSE